MSEDSEKEFTESIEEEAEAEPIEESEEEAKEAKPPAAALAGFVKFILSADRFHSRFVGFLMPPEVSRIARTCSRLAEVHRIRLMRALNWEIEQQRASDKAVAAAYMASASTLTAYLPPPDRVDTDATYEYYANYYMFMTRNPEKRLIRMGDPPESDFSLRTDNIISNWSNRLFGTWWMQRLFNNEVWSETAHDEEEMRIATSHLDFDFEDEVFEYTRRPEFYHDLLTRIDMDLCTAKSMTLSEMMESNRHVFTFAKDEMLHFMKAIAGALKNPSPHALNFVKTYCAMMQLGRSRYTSLADTQAERIAALDTSDRAFARFIYSHRTAVVAALQRGGALGLEVAKHTRLAFLKCYATTLEQLSNLRMDLLSVLDKVGAATKIPGYLSLLQADGKSDGDTMESVQKAVHDMCTDRPEFIFGEIAMPYWQRAKTLSEADVNDMDTAFLSGLADFVARINSAVRNDEIAWLNARANLIPAARKLFDDMCKVHSWLQPFHDSQLISNWDAGPRKRAKLNR